ncbi:hypothetical protein BsWGS_00453 [Bradybaena similaris]
MLLAAVTAVLLPLIAFLWVLSLLYANVNPDYASPSTWRWIVSVLVPAYVVVNGVKKKRLSQSGAVAGLTIGFLLSISCMRFLLSLLTFFIFGSKATKYQASKKRQIEADYKEGGQRNWIQVISNGGPAAILAIFYVWEVGSVDLPVDFSNRYAASWYAVAVMSAIASSCGDTFASEIGAVSGVKDPLHVLTWKQVPRGTNGGISVVGTLCSAFGGLLVGAAFYVTELLIASRIQLSESPPQWPVLFYGALAGFVGSMVDSCLGATLQYSGKHRKTGHIVEYKGPDIEHISGRELLDNHSVNLLSSLVTGLVIPYIAAQTWFFF